MNFFKCHEIAAFIILTITTYAHAEKNFKWGNLSQWTLE